jgi:DNA-binding transcriptional MerR regulator
MQSVVDRTGVPAETIRSWERRHGFPAPARGAQNQRLYSEDDIQSILRLKERTAQGIPVREALRLLPEPPRADLRPEHAIQHTRGCSSPRAVQPETLSPTADRLVDALLSFDGATAKEVLHSELVTQSPDSVAFGVILPVAARLRNVSDSGAAFATEFLRRILISLFHASDPDTGQDRVVIAGVSGTGDELLALAHALAASRMGFVAVWLGTDSDLGDVQQAISRLDPAAAILVAEDGRTTATAERWWTHLGELPSLRAWSRKRFIASPHPPGCSDPSDGQRPLWLRPEAGSAQVLRESAAVDHRGTIQMVSKVSNQ